MTPPLLPATLLLLTSSIASQDPAGQSVITTMCTVCADGLAGNTASFVNFDTDAAACKSYTTPLNQCYNAQNLFPGDESWSAHDIYDTISMMNMKRTFYKSSDGTCSNALTLWELSESAEDAGVGDFLAGGVYDHYITQEGGSDDYFILPFDECVGPFGPPRPWGKFTLVQKDYVSPVLGIPREIRSAE